MTLHDWCSKAASLEGALSGAVDPAPVEDRSGVLNHVGDTLGSALLAVGEPKLILGAASSAPDTDFAVEPVEITLGGQPSVMSHGIVHASRHHGYDSGRSVVPDGAEPFKTVVAPVAVLLGAGSRIRVDVPSYDLPSLHRNQQYRQAVLVRRPVEHAAPDGQSTTPTGGRAGPAHPRV
jgi:hypothetical protein